MQVTQQQMQVAAASVAAFLLAYHIARPLLRLLLHHFVLTRLCSHRSRLRRCGSWAIVTGATDGIGKAYAQLLAKEKLNIVLVSRSQEKLQDVAAELQSKYKVDTRTVAADFTREDIYDSIERQLEGLDIAVLVNNVGMGNPHPNFFVADDNSSFDIGLYCSMLNTNCLSMLRMSRIVLQQMLQRGKGGYVVNVASASGLNPTPFLSVYSATKAFAVFFSRAVSAELRRLPGGDGGGQRIVVQTVAPYFVATKLSKIRRPSFFAPTPLGFASEALGLLGVEDFTVGCFSHALQQFAIDLLPSCIVVRLLANAMDSTRRAALKRAARDASKDK